jgi:hypothetical protein
MARLRQGGQDVLNLIGGGRLMAHLQTAAFEQFREGHGFFITFIGGTDDNDNLRPTSSLWCPPSVPLQFIYDDSDEPTEIEAGVVDALRRAMNDPIGVIIAGSSDIAWPFTLLKTERLPPRTEIDNPDA